MTRRNGRKSDYLPLLTGLEVTETCSFLKRTSVGRLRVNADLRTLNLDVGWEWPAFVSPEPSYKTWSTNSIRRRSSENSSLLLLSACIIGCPTGALQLLTARLMDHLTIANPWTHDLTNAGNRPPWSWFEMLSVPQRQ
ncbi:hypothetical protein LA080_002360 [Diaporthe eres]|nr:hypothetical protein LA080_002360 [Diaporthe eres]